MSDPIYDMKAWLENSGIVNDYTIQADEWKDDDDKTQKAVTIYANGGANEGNLQSNPAFRLKITGPQNGKTRGTDTPSDIANRLIEYAKDNFESGCLALIQPLVMPSGVGYTEQRRPFVELNLTTIIT